MQYLEIFFYLLFGLFFFSFVSLAPWIPTKRNDLRRVNDIIKLKSGEKFLEMGCGTAKVSLFIAKNNPDAYITGIELSLFFYVISKVRIFFSGLDNIKIIYGNALKLDLEKYDVLYVFGLPETITNKLFPKINSVKNKNFRLVSYCFKMTNDYFKEIKYKPENRFAIYEYKL